MLIKSHVNYALMWVLRILGPIKFCKGPIKISNGPLKLGNLHVFEWDMGHWPILWAHHHFELGLTLNVTLLRKASQVKQCYPIENSFIKLNNATVLRTASSS